MPWPFSCMQTWFDSGCLDTKKVGAFGFRPPAAPDIAHISDLLLVKIFTLSPVREQNECWQFSATDPDRSGDKLLCSFGRGLS
ncbi:hypothetical protein AAHA92_26628 [Salvia divinorum]|uniref:Uncharacterized protein n=1 Tax=Salvia divinorum TaxID=28513 RepID=A0ABD1GEV2_SALDI